MHVSVRNVFPLDESPTMKEYVPAAKAPSVVPVQARLSKVDPLLNSMTYELLHFVITLGPDCTVGTSVQTVRGLAKCPFRIGAF